MPKSLGNMPTSMAKAARNMRGLMQRAMGHF
jgi:hypothetical protein